MIVLAETAEDLRAELLLWLRARERIAAENAARLSGTCKAQWDTAVACYQDTARVWAKAEIGEIDGH